MAICLGCRTPRGVRTASDNVFLHLLDAAELFLRLALDGGFEPLQLFELFIDAELVTLAHFVVFEACFGLLHALLHRGGLRFVLLLVLFLFLFQFAPLVQTGDVQELSNDEQHADRQHGEQVFLRRGMLDDHLTRDGKKHDVHHRIDGVARDHLEHLRADQDKAGVAHAVLQIVRVPEQVGDAGRADKADARYDTADQDERADHHFDHRRAERQSVPELVLHFSLSPYSSLFFSC